MSWIGGKREVSLEDALVAWAQQRGGVAIKLGVLSRIGLPDYMVLLPGAVIFFVELKAPLKDLRPNQAAWLKRLRDLGFLAGRARSMEDIERLVDLQ